MRTVTYGAACSLDMFIVGPGGSVDWLVWSDDVQQIMADFWKDIDAVVTGRKTYEFALKSDGGGSMSGVKGYVCSRTLPESTLGGETLVRDAVPFVRDLKGQPGKGVCLLGGGVLARSLFEAGLIDEVGLNIHPVLLGGGVPVVPGPLPRTHLDLIESRTLKGGCVLVTYRVKTAHARKGS